MKLKKCINKVIKCHLGIPLVNVFNKYLFLLKQKITKQVCNKNVF